MAYGPIQIALLVLTAHVPSSQTGDAPIVVPSTKVVPRGFTGHNVTEVGNQIHNMYLPTKDMFETTAEFEKRKRGMKTGPLIGDLTIKSYFAFGLDVPSLNYDYDADREMATIDMVAFPFLTNFQMYHEKGLLGFATYFGKQKQGDDAPARDAVGTYTAQTYNQTVSGVLVRDITGGAFKVSVPGLTQSDNPYGGFKIKFKMPIAKAREELKQLQCLLVGHIDNSSDVEVSESYTGQETREKPTRLHTEGWFLYYNLEAILIFNPNTGEVIQTIKIPQSN